MFNNEDDFLSALPEKLREPIVKFIAGVKDTLNSLNSESSDLAKGVIETVKGLFTEVGDFIHDRVSNISDLFSKPLKFFKDTLEGVKDLAGKVGDIFHDIKDKYDQLTDKPGHIFDGIKNWFDGLLDGKQEKTSDAEFNLYQDAHDNAVVAHSAIEANGVATANADMHSVM
ncbi:hypothetical protein [Serratia sp. FGI94]|uniref:hypothetical protein n=1 Tax=Serratia sp. FGI94 TaxID=671990 RepID=UPI000311E1AB|nr:hypothetical protein [Serratia sp. FGI94]